MSSQNNKTLFSVSAYLDDIFIMQSEYFNNRETCEDICDELMNVISSSVEKSRLSFHIFESVLKQTFIHDKQEHNLKDMTLEKYKKGILLRPPYVINQRDEGCINKYFLGGWWMPKHAAWFFKRQHLDMLISYNAEVIGPLKNEISTNTNSLVEDSYYSSDDSQETGGDSSIVVNNNNVKIIDSAPRIDLVNCHYENYGKGYIVRPYKSHKDYGRKYYGEGWWMPSQNGWFFKKQF